MKEIGKRRQKQFDKKSEEKELISMWKKKMSLIMAKRSLNKVELEKPERWGYIRFFVLRDDIAKSKDADFYKGLLKHVQNGVTSRDKKFEYKDYKTKKKVPIGQGIRGIDLKTWNKLELSEKQKACFEKRWKNNPLNRGGFWEYEFTKPWMFVFKTEPYYITHRYLIDPTLEKELKELQNRIEKQNLEPKISKAMGWKYGWRDFYDAKKKLLEEATDVMVKEDIQYFEDWGGY